MSTTKRYSEDTELEVAQLAHWARLDGRKSTDADLQDAVVRMLDAKPDHFHRLGRQLLNDKLDSARLTHRVRAQMATHEEMQAWR